MAASSSSSSHHRNKYDVFLSFRGEETRHNFTSHLCEALRQKNIETFIDELSLIRGNEISKSLLDAIEASAISLIIFSEGYASSRWCLDELIKIFECKNQHRQIVIPVFYGVDPSHVRHQTGIFGDLFSKLEHQWGPEKMKIWRTALTEAANLSGVDSRNTRLESELIKEVVNHIVNVKRLPKVFPCDDNLVGVDSIIKEIESLLALGSDAKDACKLGLWGIGGIGKTTIARAIFYRISYKFDGSCFLQNVREESERPGGLSCLQQKLVAQLLKDENVILGFDHLMFRRLSGKKILIILDDVTCFKQIESVIGSFNWFMPQSRIIITARNKQVLRNCGVEKIYKVKALGDHRALELFSRHAFQQNHSEIGYEEHSKKVINYAKGVPLAIKVLGCYLFGMEKEVWESAIKKLEKIPNPKIQEVLKISYDDLDDQEKNIFLDVACFLNGEDKCSVMNFLNESGFYAEIGICVLIDKSLVIREGNKIRMHDLLQVMGREIVRQESSKNPEKRSRLWDHEDIINVLKFNKGTEAIAGICLDMGKVNEEIRLNPDTFSKMPNLRFLKLYNSIKNGENKFKVSYFQGSGFAEVRYLHWHGYPLKSLPSNIHMEKLVSLEMPHSNIEQLWNSVPHHGNLTQIIMEKFFARIPNPSLTSHPNKLVTLNLSGCKNLKSIPVITDLESLKELNLCYCSKLKRLPEFSSSNIEIMWLSRTAIEELPSSIVCLSRLHSLILGNCRSLKSLPNNLGKLKSLKELHLSYCPNLQRLPDVLRNLQEFTASKTAIREVQSSILNVGRVDLRGSRDLSWPTPLSLDGLHGIRWLNLFGCGITELPESLFQLVSLEELWLGNNKFERIPKSIIQLSKLKELYLRNCERLQSLPELPLSLYHLCATGCTSLESVQAPLLSNEHPEQCIELMENFKLDGNKIVKDALQILQLKATARWKHVGEEVSYGSSRGYVILPGNEIPRCFRYQSMGSSVSSKGTILGFAISAVLADLDTWISVRCQFKYESKDADPLDFDFWFTTFNTPFFASKYDHIFLGYYFFNYYKFNDFKPLNCLPDTIHVYFEKYSIEKPLACLSVKEYEIHFFYFLEDPFNCKEEEDPQPKIFKFLGHIDLN